MGGKRDSKFHYFIEFKWYVIEDIDAAFSGGFVVDGHSFDKESQVQVVYCIFSIVSVYFYKSSLFGTIILTKNRM